MLCYCLVVVFFFFSSRRRHTRLQGDWSSDVCSSDLFRAFKAETNGKIDGYAVIQETIGKHRPITYLVGVTPDGKVSDIEVLVYRESKGSEVRMKRFNSHYEGKTVLEPIRINKDIINITGATVSVRSVSA